MRTLFEFTKYLAELVIVWGGISLAIFGSVGAIGWIYERYTEMYPRPDPDWGWLERCETIEKKLSTWRDEHIKQDYQHQAEIETNYNKLDERVKKHLLELHERTREMRDQHVARVEKRRDEVCAQEAAERP